MLSSHVVKNDMPHRCWIALLFIVLLFSWRKCLSQADTATVSGTVVDATAAGIAGATIDLQNNSTGVHVATTANHNGAFVIVGIRPGHYELSVAKEGFATTKLDDILLNVGDQKALEIKLRIGSISDVVDVNEGGLTINTTDASVSTVIDRKFVENVPLNGRSFQDLISLTPGVVTQSPQAGAGATVGNRGDFSVNGQRTESNYYTIDGVSGNVNPGTGSGGSGGNGTIAASTALGTTQSLLSVDSLEEFRVTSSTYAAEYGHGPGGQFSFATRSGTSAFHGTAFDYLRNNYFDANDWFNDHLGKPTAPLRQNDFGGTIGGPIRIPWIYNVNQKSFFFFSYEGLRLTQPKAASILYVPDTTLRSSAAAVLQPFLNAFPRQNGKEELVACTAGATSTYPCPTGDPVGTLVQSGLADFVQPYSLPATINSTSVRADHTFGPKLLVFFRFGDTPSSTSSLNLSDLTKTKVDSTSYTLGATSQLSANLTNEFRLGYSSNDAAAVDIINSFGGAVPIDITTQAGLSSEANPYAEFLLSFKGVGLTHIGQGDSGTGIRNWNLTDSTSILFGAHRLKFGIDFSRIKLVTRQYSAALFPYYLNPQAVLTNQPSIFSVTKYISPTPISYNAAVYAQDEWRVNPRLSLSYGVRWEIDPAPHDEHGNDAYTLLGSVSNPASLALAPRGTPLWNTYWYNFAPRLGAAWRAYTERGRETVIRFGGGSFSDTYNEADFLGFSGLGTSATHAYTGGSIPVTPAQLNFTPAVVSPYTSAAIYAFPKHLQVPYTLQWNTSLEQAFGLSQTVTVSYVGANGRRLISQQSVSLAKLNSNFGTVYIFPGNITSTYQALQVKAQRTVSRGFQALASYTWSHSIDYGSNYVTYAATRGDADFDVRHNLSIGASWDLPNLKEGRLYDATLNGWGIDGRFFARTAFPVTLFGNSLTDPVTGQLYYSGVNLVPGKPLYLYGSQYPGGRAINGGPSVSSSAAAFTLPTGTNVGNAPRNLVRGFGEDQINLAARRVFPIRDGVSLQFRAETFNLLNHPNFGLVNGTLSNALFGQATQLLNQSLGTLASQYQQGGPRSMQFALKLQF